jgi:hypothetical protein
MQRAKSKTPDCRGVVFYNRECTTFYFFVKRNFQLFLFFLELVSFQEHSCAIPQLISLASTSTQSGSRIVRGGPHAAFSLSR